MHPLADRGACIGVFDRRPGFAERTEPPGRKHLRLHLQQIVPEGSGEVESCQAVIDTVPVPQMELVRMGPEAEGFRLQPSISLGAANGDCFLERRTRRLVVVVVESAEPALDGEHAGGQGGVRWHKHERAAHHVAELRWQRERIWWQARDHRHHTLEVTVRAVPVECSRKMRQRFDIALPRPWPHQRLTEAQQRGRSIGIDRRFPFGRPGAGGTGQRHRRWHSRQRLLAGQQRVVDESVAAGPALAEVVSELGGMFVGPVAVQPLEGLPDSSVQRVRRVADNSATSVSWISACVKMNRPIERGSSSITRAASASSSTASSRSSVISSVSVVS